MNKEKGWHENQGEPYKVVKLDTHLEVTITNGTVVKIDHDDEWILEEFPSWQKCKGHIWCLRVIDTPYGPARQRIYLHRIVIMGKNSKREKRLNWAVDHANRDGMDNRRANLRMATRSQNAANTVRTTRSNTGYRGVTDTRRPLRKRFVAHCSGKNMGFFLTPEEAARAYDAKAKEIYGPFAVLNFPEGAKLESA